MILNEISGLNFVVFEAFNNLEILVINQSDLKNVFSIIAIGLPLIPSPKFRVLQLITADSLDFRHIDELTNAVKKLQRQVKVDVRCEKLTLRMVLKDAYPVPAMAIQGFSIHLEKVKTRIIVRYSNLVN